MEQKKRVIVIGGGAAGLVAAITAAEEGAAVTVLEQNENPGRKICVTGNGRCNLTNRDMRPELFRGNNPEIARKVLGQFSLEDTLKFFQETGLSFAEKNGWIYPGSHQAKAVVDLLVSRARALKVKIKTREQVKNVFIDDNCWKAETEGWTYEGDAVILANGSKASLVPGSDGSGYELAEKLGHKVILPVPALTGLKAAGNVYKGWSGVRTEGRVTLCVDGKEVCQEQGELQLTDYGISGIPVFQISRYAARALQEKKKVSVSLNFFPLYTETELREFLKKRQERCPWLGKQDIFTGILPEKLAKVLLKQKDPLKAAADFSLSIRDTSGFEQAQVCAGGVDTMEIHPETMESVLHKGLYFAGEIVDIDGPCGGYNLQWAWSSGAVAGRSSAKELI